MHYFIQVNHTHATVLYKYLVCKSNGANSVSDGANSVSDGANSVSDGANSVSDGANSVSDGANSVSDGANSVSDGANSVSDGAFEPFKAKAENKRSRAMTTRLGFDKSTLLYYYGTTP